MTVHTPEPQVVAEGDGYRIEKRVRASEYSGRSFFAVFEGDSSASSTAVEVFHPEQAFGALRGSRVSWPSTSDKRPALARLLAEALVLAADEADRLNGEAIDAATDAFFESAEPGSVTESKYAAKRAEIAAEVLR